MENGQLSMKKPEDRMASWEANSRKSENNIYN